MNGLGPKLVRGVTWMVAFKAAERAISIASTIVLARLLLPADFGLVAMAMSVVLLLELMTAFNFDVVLIQRQDPDRRAYDTVWTLNLIVYSAGAGVLLALAGASARFFDEPRLELLVTVLSAATLLQGLENVGLVAFRKELRLDKEFRFLCAKKLISALVTIGCAIAFRSYWALVAGILTGRAVGVALSYSMHPYRPRLSFAVAGELLHFSKWLALHNVLLFLNERLAHFVVGKIGGAHALGIFALASEIATIVINDLVGAANRAIFPGYAKMAADLPTLRQGFLSVVGLMGLLAVPMGIGIALVADPLVKSLLGEAWTPGVPVIQLLAVASVLGVVQVNMTYILLALGQPGRLSFLTGLRVALLAALLVPGIQGWGIVGAAWVFVVAELVILPPTYRFVAKPLQINLVLLLRSLWRPTAASVVMALVLGALPQVAAPLVELFLRVSLGFVTYAGALLLLWWAEGRPEGAEMQVLRWSTARLRAQAAP